MTLTARTLIRSIVLVLLTLVTLAPAGAQTLSVQGDRFAIDGTPRFLVFISYFGAMSASNVPADLKYIRSKGFDGVRIWPNFPRGHRYQLMRADGTLNPEGVSRLQFILDRARDERLVVDVSFTAEHVSGLDAARFRDGLAAATDVLRGYDNLLFDLQNERNVYGPFGRPLSGDDVASIRAAVKSVHPARIVTASNSSERTPEYSADFAAQTGLDVNAYHDPRTSQFAVASWVQQIVDALKATGRPAYLQEPMPARYVFFPISYQSEPYREQMRNAKLSGAAAYCFHMTGTGEIDDSTFQDFIEANPEPDRAFVDTLLTRVALKASNGSNFVSAAAGGGGDVRADKLAAAPWETFKVVTLSGGPLVSGDRVAFLAADDTHYLQAVGGGGAALRAVGTQIGAFETFIIEKADGGAIRDGDVIRIRTASSSWYVSAESGGGGSVNVNRPSPGAWETFTVSFVR